MHTADYKTILSELALYTTFLAAALSPTEIPTFCELLFGGMLSEQGFVTQGLLFVQFQCRWSRYHHWITHGKWLWKSLACRLIQLVCSHAQKLSLDGVNLLPWLWMTGSWNVFPIRFLLVEYITSTARSEIAPPISGVCVGSRWLLSWSAQWMKSSQPSLFFHSRHRLLEIGFWKFSKLKIATAMLKVVRQEVQQLPLRLLADCWYMNWILMQPALEMGYEIIGQIPCNRALYALPEVAIIKKRGRTRTRPA